MENKVNTTIQSPLKFIKNLWKAFFQVNKTTTQPKSNQKTSQEAFIEFARIGDIQNIKRILREKPSIRETTIPKHFVSRQKTDIPSAFVFLSLSQIQSRYPPNLPHCSVPSKRAVSNAPNSSSPFLIRKTKITSP